MGKNRPKERDLAGTSSVTRVTTGLAHSVHHDYAPRLMNSVTLLQGSGHSILEAHWPHGLLQL